MTEGIVVMNGAAEGALVALAPETAVADSRYSSRKARPRFVRTSRGKSDCSLSLLLNKASAAARPQAQAARRAASKAERFWASKAAQAPVGTSPIPPVATPGIPVVLELMRWPPSA